jgi:ribonuclease HII
VLEPCYKKDCLEAGLDEAGRGCLAGPVFAAAVILPPDYSHSFLRDSKTLNHKQREFLRSEIEKNALSFSVKPVDERTIDSINILKASIKAMHLSVKGLSIKPEHLVVDGNHFLPYLKIPHKTVIKGDNTYMNIAAASILAKTYRDEWMEMLHKKHPEYNWAGNKGYGTKAHVEAIKNYGLTSYHRRSFKVKSLLQYSLFQNQSLG